MCGRRLALTLCAVGVLGVAPGTPAFGATTLVELAPTTTVKDVYANALNDSGLVVGQATFGGQPRGFIWSTGSFTPLASASGVASSAWDINRSGRVIGDSTFGAAGTGTNGVTWNGLGGANSPIALPYLNAGVKAPEAQPIAIDDAGNVVGYSRGSDDFNGIAAVRWPLNGAPVPLLPGATCPTGAYATNNTGGVLVRCTNRLGTSLWKAGAPTTPLTCLEISGAGGLPSRPLSDADVVVGHRTGGNPLLPATPTQWKAGTCTDLKKPAGFDGAMPLTINTGGASVGYAYRAEDNDAQRAVLWAPDGSVSDLNALVPANAGVTLTSAIDINDRGDILVRGTRSGTPNVERSFVLTRKGDEVEFSTPQPGSPGAPGVAGFGYSYKPLQGGWWTTFAATGMWSVPATIKVVDDKGKPVAGEAVVVRDLLWVGNPPVGGGGPRAVLCDDTWKRVESGVERRTGADGTIDLTVLLGTDAALWRLTAAEKADAGIFDLGQFEGTIGAVSPSVNVIRALVRGETPPPAGLGKLGKQAGSQVDMQEGLLDWLLAYRAKFEAAAPPTGEFAPIRSRDGKAAGIVFYPAGAPGPLRAYLAGERATPPADALVLPIVQEGGVWKAKPNLTAANLPGAQLVMPLADWVAANGPAVAGYVRAHPNESLAYLGYPYPPSIGSPRRASYDSCVPGASPGRTQLDLHSPLRLVLRDAKGRRFGLLPSGKAVDQVGGYIRRGAGGAVAYVVPSGTYTAQLAGTGSGAATIVATTATRTGAKVRVFSLRARRGATGTLKLTTAGATGSLRFAGRTVRAASSLGLRVSGIPAGLRARRPATLRVRVSDQFGIPLPGALVTVTAGRAQTRALTDGKGNALLALTTPASGRLTARISAPRHTTLSKTITIRR